MGNLWILGDRDPAPKRITSMALKDLTQKILDDARARADEISARGKEHVATVQAQTQESLRARHAAFDAETQKLLAADAFRARERTQHEARLTRETARRRVLDDAFANALDVACNADDATYRARIEPALQTLAANQAELTALYTSQARRELTETTARACGIMVPVLVRPDIRGGFVAEGPDATYNMHFEHLLETVRRGHESVIAHTLFSS